MVFPHKSSQSVKVRIKTTSGVISVILGYLFFKEKNIKERLFGAAIMVIGVLFIVLL